MKKLVFCCVVAIVMCSVTSCDDASSASAGIAGFSPSGFAGTTQFEFDLANGDAIGLDFSNFLRTIIGRTAGGALSLSGLLGL